MVSGKAMQAERAVSERVFPMERDTKGSVIERRERMPRWLQEQLGTPDGEMDEADDYPSGAGLVAMFTAALLGMLVLATLSLLVQVSSGY